jgi:hypothetical protein
MRWTGHVARMAEMKRVCNIFVENRKGKRTLGSHRRKWEDNIKIYLREMGLEVVDWICLAQNWKTAMKFRAL